MAVEGAWGHFLWRSSVQDVGCWADASSREKSESLGRFPGELELVVAPPHCHIRSLGFLRAGLVLRLSGIWVKISLRWFQASADALFHDTDYSKSECFRRCSSDYRNELNYSIFHGKKIEKGDRKVHSLVYFHVRNTGTDHMVEVSEACFTCTTGCTPLVYSFTPLQRRQTLRFSAVDKGEHFAFKSACWLFIGLC